MHYSAYVRQLIRRLPVSAILALLFVLAQGAQAAGKAPAFPNYRDLKVYTTSAPDAKNPAKIIARTQFVNEGKTSTRISAKLNASRMLKISGGQFTKNIQAGKSADWTWSFIAPAGLQREILTGSIDINGRKERDLFLSVLGPDPADLKDNGVEKITELARVVATYAPRAQASTLAEMRALEAKPQKPLLTLAAAGKTDYTIVVSVLPVPPPGRDAMAYWKGAGLAAPQQDLLDALDDLQRVLRLQSGAAVPIAAKTDSPAILLRQADLGEAAKGLQDAYRLQTAGKDVIIEAADVEGLRNGIYGLLTDHLDCHWFQPRLLGEEIVIPRDHAVRLPALHEVNGSKWFSNGGASWWNDGRWDRRNRALVNRGRIWFGHSWNQYIAKEEFPYEKFPEYYARDRQGNVLVRDPADKGTFTNFCTTHPEVIEIVAKKINALFDANPDAILASLDPNDYAPFCLCDRCLALDKHYGQTKEDGTEITDRLLHFTGEISSRLKPEHKDKFLGVLIYGYQIELPKSATPPDNLAAYICNMAWTYDHSRPWNDPTSSFNRHFYNLVKGWGSLLPQMGYYDYYGHWSFYGPWAMVHKIREDLPAFHDLGGTYMVLEAQPNFAGQGLNHYICNLLTRDIDADVDLAMEEFFQKYYGPAAAPMRDYWLGAEKWYALERPSTNGYPRAIQHAEFWTELEGSLRQARELTAALPAEGKRFAERVRHASDGFEYGRFFYEYELNYGRLARGRKQAIDHAAAIEYLRNNRAPAEAIRKKYSPENPDYPMLIPTYYVQDIDAMIDGHAGALKKEE